MVLRYLLNPAAIICRCSSFLLSSFSVLPKSAHSELGNLNFWRIIPVFIPVPIRKDMDKEPSSSTRGKRKREYERASSSPGSEANPSFIQRAEAAAVPLLEMLKDCQLQLLSHTNSGGTIDCCATYSFSKDIKDIKSQQMNDYGRGQLKVVRIRMDGADIQPLPEWLESRISLQAYFEKKVATNNPHSSGDSKKRGFEVPWRADIQLESIPVGCVVESLQLTFICPTDQGSPTIIIHPDQGANLYYVNDRMRNITGQTYSECCQELGIFRQATVYVKMRVPFRLLMREQLSQLRKGIPVTMPDVDPDALKGLDSVSLKNGRFSLKVGREVLCEISGATDELFGEKKSGKNTVYEMKYGKDAVSAVVHAGVAKFGGFPLDPLTVPLSVLHEVVCLSLDWDVVPLKHIAQFALLERLCTPGFHADTVSSTVEYIWTDGSWSSNEVGKCLLAGFIIVLQSMGANGTRGVLPAGVQRDTLLWRKIKDVIEPTVNEVETPPDVAKPQTDGFGLYEDFLIIRVIQPHGNEIHFRVKRSARIKQIKAALHSSLGIPSAGFRLIFDGNVLDDDKTVADYNMEDGDSVDMRTEQSGC